MLTRAVMQVCLPFRRVCRCFRLLRLSDDDEIEKDTDTHIRSRLWSNKLRSNKISFDCPVTRAIFHVFMTNREGECLFQGHYILYAHTALPRVFMGT